MKSFIAIIALISMGLFACNTTDQSKKNLPVTNIDTTNFTRIQWQDSIVNFGSVNMGEKIQVVFKFKNIGENPLILTNVRAGCGCTVPDYTKGAIAPGGEGVVTGEFDTNKAHPGEVHKNIFVTTNTQNGINHTLTFGGTIKETAPAN